MVVAGADRAAVHHEDTKDTKDTKNSVIVGCALTNHLLFFVSFVVLRAFVCTGRTMPVVAPRRPRIDAVAQRTSFLNRIRCGWSAEVPFRLW